MKTTDTELHQIQYKFSKEEIAEFSGQLADSCQKKAQTESDKKEAMSSFKAKIDAQGSHIRLLSSRISTGYEFQTQPCLVKKDFKKGIKEYYYQGVLYDTVKMSAEDHQLRLDANAADEKDLDFLK